MLLTGRRILLFDREMYCAFVAHHHMIALINLFEQDPEGGIRIGFWLGAHSDARPVNWVRVVDACSVRQVK